MRWQYLKLRFNFLLVAFLFSFPCSGVELKDARFEDLYGEWYIDKAILAGNSTYSYEDIIENRSGPILIGPGVYVPDYCFCDGFTWAMDTLSDSDGGYPPTKAYTLDAIFDGTLLSFHTVGRPSWKHVRFYMQEFGYIVTSVDYWFVFYKKVNREHHTDFADPFIQELFGTWEQFQINSFSIPVYEYEEIETLFASPIEFNRHGYFDHRATYHTITFETDTSSDRRAFKNAFRFLPDSVKTHLGIITQVTVFSDDGYILNRFVLSQNDILADYFDDWFILYRKQPPPPLKKQGAQP